MVFRVPAEDERENLLTTVDRVFRVGNTRSLHFRREIYMENFRIPPPSDPEQIQTPRKPVIQKPCALVVL